jgi:hypothetical protein
MPVDNFVAAPYRVARFMPEQPISPRTRERFGALSIIEWYRVPLHERVVDCLADLMFDADDLLEMCKAEDTRQDFRWLEPDIRRVYERVNELMHRITD